mgnify:CR=1 FL=1
MTKEPTIRLYGEFKADVWAKEFLRIVKEKPEISQDVDTMRGWFANAIMTGYDLAHQEILKKIPSEREIKRIMQIYLLPKVIKDESAKGLRVPEMAEAIHNLLTGRMG